MVDILMFSACALFGIAVASVLAGLNKKPFGWIINMFSSALLTTGGFVYAAFVYTKLSHKELSFSSLFPDRVSLLIGMFFFIILSVIVGFFVGAVSGGGINRYMMRLYKSRVFYPIGALVLTLTIAVTCLCAYPLLASKNRADIVINEICHHNFNLICDSEENYSDYIELYNSGDNYVELSTFYLSDSPNEKDKFRLPEYILAPGEYILIWADSSDKGFSNDAIYANFSLSDNETVILSNSYYKPIDAISLPSLPHNVSVTWLGDDWVYAYGTPLQSNEGCILYKAPTLSSPVFSIESGFYTEDVVLEIKAQKGADIYYTTDGSVPDESSTKYTGALTLTDISDRPNKIIGAKNTVYDYDNHIVSETPVEKANIIRAIAINNNGEISEVINKTYFVGKDAMKYEGYSIMSVIADPDDLFGTQGICVTGEEYDKWYNETDRSTASPEPNFMKHGKQWEKKASLQLWDESGKLILDQDCGIRVQGNTSRLYETKRFSFFAREAYSDSRFFNAALFSERTNVHSMYTKESAVDNIMAALSQEKDLAVQNGTPVVLFIDGELYSVTYLKERQDSDYFYERYGIPEEELVVITESALDIGTEADLDEYEDLIKYLTEQDTTDPLVYSEICKRMDVQSFIDFMAITLYANNLDVGVGKNFKLWRTRTARDDGYSDGRWRVALYDTDAVEWSYYVRTDSTSAQYLETDSFRWCLNYGNYKKAPGEHIPLPFFSNLLRNDSFRDQFATTFLDIANETFSINGSGKKALDSIGEGNNEFFLYLLKNRAPYAIGNMKNAFGITESNCSVFLEVSAPDGGQIKINTVIADTSDGEWTGEYISGYTVTVTAIPKEGYRFAGWEGYVSSDEESLSITLSEEGIALRAIFEKEGNG